MNKQGSFVVGLVAGLAAGAVLGLLYAPDKG
jgi:gas vesicle protein